MENEAVILNKFESIERCIKRINEEYEENPENLNDYRRLDSIVLNLQRSCELVTDIAMYIVSCRKLGMPQEKREAFELLQKNRWKDFKRCNRKSFKWLIRFCTHNFKFKENIRREKYGQASSNIRIIT